MRDYVLWWALRLFVCYGESERARLLGEAEQLKSRAGLFDQALGLFEEVGRRLRPLGDLPVQNLPCMAHLLKLGPDKPLGYLPLETLEENGHDPELFAERLREHGRLTHLVTESEGGVRSGALYVCDPAALAALLDHPLHRAYLKATKWPTDAEGFMRRVGVDWVKETEQPALYALIGRAFGDPRFAGVVGGAR